MQRRNHLLLAGKGLSLLHRFLEQGVRLHILNPPAQNTAQRYAQGVCIGGIGIKNASIFIYNNDAVIHAVQDLLEGKTLLLVQQIEQGLLLDLSVNDGLAVGNVDSVGKIRQLFCRQLRKIQITLQGMGKIWLVARMDPS